MSELRKDPIIGRWVIIATERAKRPFDFKPRDVGHKIDFCPFCPGNEDKTPKELLIYHIPAVDGRISDWWLRVVPNKFPALQNKGEIGCEQNGLYGKIDGYGTHEVIIETPDHETPMAHYDLQQVEYVLTAYQNRIQELKEDPHFQYIMIFKNHGQEAGASLDHPHSQLIALPIIPKRVKEEIDGSLAYHTVNHQCVFCEMVKQDIEENQRVVFQNDQFLAINPFASRFPFETWILPKNHRTHYEYIDEEERSAFAETLLNVLQKIDRVLSDPPFNYMLHTAPCNQSPHEFPHYHWHLEITPKLTHVAGFEWGTGFYINPVPPEKAAEYLRNSQAKKTFPDSEFSAPR